MFCCERAWARNGGAAPLRAGELEPYPDKPMELPLFLLEIATSFSCFCVQTASGLGRTRDPVFLAFGALVALADQRWAINPCFTFHPPDRRSGLASAGRGFLLQVAILRESWSKWERMFRGVVFLDDPHPKMMDFLPVSF